MELPTVTEDRTISYVQFTYTKKIDYFFVFVGIETFHFYIPNHEMTQSDGVLAFAAILSSLIYVNLWVKLSHSGFINSKVTRKIIHVTGGPVYFLFWPFFSSSAFAPVWCSLVPLVQALHLTLSGFATNKCDGKAKKVRKSLALAVSRDGDAKEALYGPLIYNAILILTTWFGWRHSLASIVSICQVIPVDHEYSTLLNVITVMVVLIMSIALSCQPVMVLLTSLVGDGGVASGSSATQRHGYLTICASEAAAKLLVVSLGCSIIEVSAPVLFGMDDNIFVPVAAILLVRCLFGNERTRHGKLLRVVQDHYLRDDVGCGIYQGRTLTPEDLANLATELGNNRKFLVMDTNAILCQMDLLEKGGEAISCVIVLGTVMSEVRRQNLSLHLRLTRLLKKEERAFVFLANEHHSELNEKQKPGEIPTEYNDRRIRVATSWLNSQLDGLDSGAILLTNDCESAEKSKSEKVAAMTVQSYVKTAAMDFPEILDMIALEEGERGHMGKDDEERVSDLQEHLAMSELMDGIKSGRFFRGVLRAVEQWTNCHILVGGKDSDRYPIHISGPQCVNRAMDGDIVAVQVISEEDPLHPLHQSKQEKIVKDVEQHEANPLETLFPETTLPPPVMDDDHDEHKQVLYGRVVGIIRRSRKTYCGTLLESGDRQLPDDSSAVSAIFSPMGEKLPRIRITTRQRSNLADKRIIVAVDMWPINSKYPLGHYVNTVGVIGDKSTETQVVLLEHNINHESFSNKVLACLPALDWAVTAKNSVGRRDLRHLPVLSIDPIGCMDIDDALHAKRLENGNIEIGVHIADVTHFVTEGTPLDVEASSRATSTYLVDKRLDMLPKLLTQTICSLRGGEDRFAFSVIWEITEECHIINVEFFKSIIHSIAAFTYDEAQLMLDDPNDFSIAAKAINSLNKIAKMLRAKRLNAGALTLASPVVKFKLDSESQNPTDVQMYSLKEANFLVEEFMLLANITVAKKILRHFPTLSILRRHPSPTMSQFDALRSSSKAVGVKVDVGNSKELSQTLETAKRSGDPYFNKLIRILATRCMSPAQYFASGDKVQSEWHHYGLATPIYTHFTSPIRRYADVLVHRLLGAAIGVAPLPISLMDKARVHELVDNINRKHRGAQFAERASVALHAILYFKENPSTVDGYVLKIQEGSMSIIVPRFGIETKVRFPMGVDEIRLNPTKHQLIYTSDSSCARNAVTITVFDKVKVHLEVLPGKNDIHASLVQPNIPLMNDSNCISGSNRKGARFKRVHQRESSSSSNDTNLSIGEKMASPTKKRPRS